MDIALQPPRDEYGRLHRLREQEARRLARMERFAGYGRLATFAAILAVGYWIASSGSWHPYSLTAAVVAFAVFFRWRWRIAQMFERARHAMAYYRRAIDRLDDRWPGVGPSGTRYGNREHPYAKDLDLFGHGSLFQLLCATPTRIGQDMLAAWMCQGADAATILARQTAVEELRPRTDLREAIALLKPPSPRKTKPFGLVAWIDCKPRFTDRLRPGLAIGLSIASIAALVWYFIFGGGWSLCVIVGLQQGLFIRSMWKDINDLTAKLDDVLEELNLLGQVMRLIEIERFKSPLLRDITEQLRCGKTHASLRVAQLSQLVDAWETIHRNKFVIPLASVLMLTIHLAYAIERWRTKYGRAASGWRRVVGEFEALCCLSCYAYEHPEQPFPIIAERGPCFEAKRLGHPLIPAHQRVANDVRISEQPRLLLVTGSNMSGKSTLLRAIGINAVLALAGAPVCAERMVVSHLVVGTAMRTADSLQEGISSFYAEIKRLRTICDLAANKPVLFLLDEILHGTNSHDRRLGAEAVVKNLLKHGAIGLITTHDLALAEIASALDHAAANVHFEDQFTDNRISFDYRLRPGVVPKGNGLELMRMLGFDV